MKRLTRTFELPLLAFPDSATHDKTIHLRTRQVPEIDGSKGAFIAVVVTLSVLIVVCCTAVFYLLRYHEPTDQDRVLRRERYRRPREQTLTSTSHSSFSGPSTLVGSGSLGERVKQVWQSTTGRGRGRGRRGGGGHGWIRAGSDDEWGSRSDHASEGGGGDTHPDPHSDPELGGQLPTLSVLKQDASGGMVGGRGDGVRVVESPSSETDTASGFGHGRYGYGYVDPFAKTVLEGTFQRSQSPLSSSSPVSSPRDGASVDESQEAHSPGEDHRHRSTMSNGSVWTQAGSKFVEDI